MTQYAHNDKKLEEIFKSLFLYQNLKEQFFAKIKDLDHISKMEGNLVKKNYLQQYQHHI
jgi:hypothetical protein